MQYDSPKWDWGKGSCELHRGQDVPCKICIEQKHPDLFDAIEVKRVMDCWKQGHATNIDPTLMQGNTRELGRQARGVIFPPCKDQIKVSENWYLNGKFIGTVEAVIKGRMAGPAQNLRKDLYQSEMGIPHKGIFEGNIPDDRFDP